MKKDEIEEKIKELIINSSEGQIRIIDSSKDLVDYGLNSLTYIQLLVGIEEIFNVEFEEEYLRMGVLGTVEKIVDYIVERIEKNK